jgi:hypothetical protein
MADIADRCERALAEHIAQLGDDVTSDFYWQSDQTRADFWAGYMAGVDQARTDYLAHFKQTGGL